MAKVSIMRILIVFAATSMLVDMALSCILYLVSSIYQLMMLLIVKVTEANYGSCGTGNAISKTDINPTTIPLTAAGSRYFSSGLW
ncbi:cupredoxin [Artemisia annua]|uniref:Cupredoxin n=1 Tax=Artemisia annua TaxID=35608 RepID=A0A2U1K9F6_ARTAN|nr:cupredoxin [Artemisia annua]